MENNGITKHSPIKPINIDYNHFTLSLLNEGLRSEILAASQVEQVQVKLMLLLSETILQYTRNESSSVKVETAENILQSILYNIDFYLMRFPSFEQAIDALLNMPLAELCIQGLKLVNQEVILAKQLLKEVQETKLPVSLIAYNDTIYKAISEFFSTYDAKFNAHDTQASIDYPLLFDDIHSTGITYIKRYLENLKLENELCSHFSLSNINLLLEGYGRKYRMNYRDVLINIPELILKNALCLTIIGKQKDTLLMNKVECRYLESHLQNLSAQQLASLLQSAMRKLISSFSGTNLALESYVQPLINAFCPSFYNAVNQRRLSDLLVLSKDKDAATHNKIYYEAGKKLSDEQLQAVIEKLTECKNGVTKANIIESSIHNIEDLIDVFGAYCIFDAEYATIFDRFADYELAILCLDLIDNSPLSNSKDLCVDTWHSTENEIYWQEKLINYLESGEPTRYKNIVHLAAEVRENF